jgi:RimJ/RimL family protein N-acetyltransferase
MTIPQIKLITACEEHAPLLTLSSQRAYDKAAVNHGKTPWGPRGYKSTKGYLYYIEKLETYCISYEEIIVGGIVVSENGFNVKEILRIFVDPDFQRRGIGTEALLKLINISNVNEWTAGTIKWNHENTRFLEKNGFSKIGEIKGDEPYLWYQKKINCPCLPTIKELSVNNNRVIVEGKVVEKAIPRTVRSRRGWQTLTVQEATLKDDSDDIVLILWNDQIKQCVVGDRVRIEGGYVKVYRGIRQLNVGKTGKLITLD